MPWRRKVLIRKEFQGEPETVGEHILRKRRRDGLTQAQVGERLGTDLWTVGNWEKGRTKVVPTKMMPAIIAYLGYNPEPKPESIGGQLRWKRRSLGWTTWEAARRYSVDPSSWEVWEKQEDWPAYSRHCELLRRFLSASPCSSQVDRTDFSARKIRAL